LALLILVAGTEVLVVLEGFIPGGWPRDFVVGLTVGGLCLAS